MTERRSEAGQGGSLKSRQVRETRPGVGNDAEGQNARRARALAGDAAVMRLGKACARLARGNDGNDVPFLLPRSAPQAER